MIYNNGWKKNIEKIYISTKYLNLKFNFIFDQLYELGFSLFSADYKKSYFSVDPICFQSGTDRNSAVIAKKQYENLNFWKKYILV